jgi:cephalosporin-C deacetylase-like acetyl esterase
MKRAEKPQPSFCRGRITQRLAAVILLTLGGIAAAGAQRLTVTADHADGIYQIGQTVRWRVQWEGGDTPAPTVTYVVKKGGLTESQSGTVAFRDGVGDVEAKADSSGALLLEVKAATTATPMRQALGGAIIAPEQIRPSAKRPPDFDKFWEAKIKELQAVRPDPQLEKGDSGTPGVDYWKIMLNNIRGTHIQGQIARPMAGRKFPAVLIVQWTGVYGLQKHWVTDIASNGWLALNIEPHDLPIDQPDSFYQQQSAGPLKDYRAIGNEDRETSYFLRMYLACYRAAEYLAKRPDWDGRTLVVMGSSQGGQQTLVTAGLSPRITAALAEVPAGCDMLGPDVGRAPGWPQWIWNTEGNKDPKKIREAGRYFDVVNFAPRIHCPVLVGAGLIDETCPPAGVMAAVNCIPAPKEIILFPQGGHQDENHSHEAYAQRCWSVWLPALREGKAAPVAAQNPN